MRRLRTFIAVELGANVTGRAEKLIRQLRETDVDANWIAPENMHLTLKFLGEITEADAVDVCRVVQKAVREIEPFEIIFRGAGAFPNIESPKTVWIGVDDGAEALMELQAAVDEALHRELRYSREQRKFMPHLTIGRIKRGGNMAQVSEILAQNAQFDADLCVVDEVVTFSSFLSPKGPKYEALAHAPLE